MLMSGFIYKCRLCKRGKEKSMFCDTCGEGHDNFEPTTDKTLNQVADEVHKLAWDKGWHNEQETEDQFVERACNNLHDEVSELHESWRNNRLRALCDKADGMAELGLTPLTCVEEELADIVIRALDNARKLGVDIQRAVETKHAYNAHRTYRHGGKRS
jgi:NTP pyrophosphatase (non-canonical NTP hydrolase)